MTTKNRVLGEIANVINDKVKRKPLGIISINSSKNDIIKDQVKEVKVGAVEKPKEAPKSEPIPEEKENCVIQCSSELPKSDCCFTQLLCEYPEYTSEIQEYLLQLQIKSRADPNYLTNNEEINSRMRTILVDWMVEVVEEYEMTPETLFLAVNFVDRFLSDFGVTRARFQLLGTTSLFIASKYEEIYPPDVHEFVFITDNAYEKHDILKMEIEILRALDYNISTPTIHYFLCKHLNTLGLELNLPQKVGIMAEYLTHLALMECDPCITYLPNDIAVSAILLSTQIFGIKLELSGEVGQAFFPSYSEEQLKAHLVKLQSCIDTLRRLRKTIKEENDALFESGKPQQAIFNKYAQEKYFSVSLLNIKD